VPEHFIELVTDDSKRHGLIGTIMLGMDNKVLDILNMSNFTVGDILSVTHDVQESGKEDRRHGIYLITYQKQKAPRLIYQYGGKTGASGGFAARGQQHKYNTTADTKSNHYKAAHGADRVMAAICYVPDSDETRQYVEQTIVSLLELYLTSVLQYQPTLVPKDMDVLEAETDVAKWSQDHEQAHMLSNLAMDSFVKSGWPGGCSRDSYGCDGGGLNWKSPIAEGSQCEQIIYTVVRNPRGNIDLYHRPAVRITQGTSRTSDSKKISLLQEDQYIKVKGGYGKFHPVIGAEGPPDGTWVNPVFEVMRDGTPHPKSWTRLPDVGAWDGFFWNFSRSWALRIDWRQGSQWRSFYIQANRVLMPRRGQSDVASHNAFAQGIAVANFLTRRWMVTNSQMPLWFYDYGVVRLKEQRFDWLKQTYTHRDEVRLVDIGTPKQRSLQDIGTQLQALGLKVGNWQQWDHSPGVERVCCDCCYVTHIRKREFNATTGIAMDTLLLNHSQQSFRSCARTAGSNQCTPCYNRGLPCSWTFSLRTAQLNDPRVKAFRPMDSAPGAVLDTAEPDLIRVSPQHVG
jgi:hypothetical protein